MKGVKIADETKDRVLTLYSIGASLEKIEAATGVSKAAASGILAEAAAEDPSIPRVHEVARICAKTNRPPASFLRGVVLEDEINAAGCTIDEALEWFIPFLKTFGADAPKMAKAAMEYEAYKQAVGKSHAEIMEEIRTGTQELEKLKSAIERKAEELATIDAKLRSLSEEVGETRDFARVKASLDKINMKPKEAADVLDRSLDLFNKKFTPQAQDALAAEFQSRDLTPETAAAEIAELAANFGSLEKGVEAKKRDLRGLREAAKRGRTRQEAQRKTIQALESQIHGLMGRLRSLQSEYGGIGKRYEARETALNKALVAKESETQKRCDSMIAGATKTRDHLVAEGIRRRDEIENAANTDAREKEETADRRVRLAAASIQRARDEENGVRKTVQAMRPQIAAAATLWGYIQSNHPGLLRRLVELDRMGPLAEQIPLPDHVRNELIDVTRDLLTQDSQVHLQRLTRQVEDQTYIRNVVVAEARIAQQIGFAETALHYQILQLPSEPARTLQEVVRELVRNPLLISKVINEASMELLTSIFMGVHLPTRDWVRGAIIAAEQKEDELVNAQPFAWFDFALKREQYRLAKLLGSAYSPPRIPKSDWRRFTDIKLSNGGLPEVRLKNAQ